MKKTLVVTALLGLSVVTFCQNAQKEFPVLTGPYFGQTHAGDTAEIFAKDLISVKGRFEFAVSLSPNGKELLAGVQEGDTAYIVYTKEINEGWTKPKKISLSNGKFNHEMEAFFTPDGKQIYFAPYNQFENIRLWSVDITPEGWTNAKQLDSIVTFGPAFYPICAANKTLYYFNISERKIFRAAHSNGKYIATEAAGFPFGFHCFIAPDESFALIDGLKDDIGKMDIYVVFKNEEGKWNEPINLGPRVNSEYNESCPSLSNDGKYIFFSRYNDVNGVSNIYWVDAKIINELKPKE